jgi:hypothetical protein
MHAQDPPQPHPNSHRLRIDAVHPHPASTSTSHLSTTCTIARSVRCPSASPSAPSALPTTLPHTPRVRVVCSVLWAAPHQDSFRTLAPRLAIAYSPRQGGSASFPRTRPSRPPRFLRACRAPVYARPPCNVAFASHTHNIASDDFLPRSPQISPCVRRSKGTNCGERLWCAPCPVPHCQSPYLSFRARICHIDVRLPSFFSIP